MIRQINQLRKKMMLLQNKPYLWILETAVKAIEKSDTPQNVKTIAREHVEGTKIGIKMAGKLMEKHQNSIFCRSRSLADIVLAAKECQKDGTLDQYIADANYVYTRTLAI